MKERLIRAAKQVQELPEKFTVKVGVGKLQSVTFEKREGDKYISVKPPKMKGALELSYDNRHNFWDLQSGLDDASTGGRAELEYLKLLYPGMRSPLSLNEECELDGLVKKAENRMLKQIAKILKSKVLGDPLKGTFYTP